MQQQVNEAKAGPATKKRKPLITSRKVISSLNRSKERPLNPGTDQSPYQMASLQIAEKIKYRMNSNVMPSKAQSQFAKEY
jgi:hypothetical protein